MARIRLKEARALLKAKCFDGAYYLCGYAVECALKACIAKDTKRSEFPDLDRVKGSYTHNFAHLVKVADLNADLNAEVAGDAAFADNWRTAQEWSQAARYAMYDESDAWILYKAITDRKHGVMRWIRRHW